MTRIAAKPAEQFLLQVRDAGLPEPEREFAAIQNKTCEHCGHRFYAPPIQVRRGGGRFCSYHCRSAVRRGANHPNYSRVEVQCAVCNTSFLAHPSKIEVGKDRFCSRECAAKSRVKARPSCQTCGQPAAIGRQFCSHQCAADARRSKVEQTCPICNNTFMAGPATISKGYAKFCSRECFGIFKAQNGEGSYTRGKGGRREDLDNRYFRSRWEANWARYLNWLIEQGQIKEWDFECITYEFPIKRGTRFYTPDFQVTNLDGSIEYHEVKGYMDKKSATKLKRMAKYHPDVRIVVIDKDCYRDVSKKIGKSLPNWETGADASHP